MEFYDNMKKLSERIKKLKDKVTTEEATKTAFILPFLQNLGYDIFDPSIVIPEFTADIGKRKGEKVDYAIVVDEKPVILLEAKYHEEKLNRHKIQLERYFTVTESKFGILTNGIEYWFYSDLNKPNVMDDSPFLMIDMLNLKDRNLRELEKFKSENFNIENILNSAGIKIHVTGIKDIFKKEIKEPSENFIKFFANQLISKPKTKSVVDEFSKYVKQAFIEIKNDWVNEKINSLQDRLSEEITAPEEVLENIEEDDGIITTEEELNGFAIVKAILAENVELNRIFYKDTKSYFGILLDNNIRKWVVRLLFNTRQKYIEIKIENKESEKFPIERIEDIYSYRAKILEALQLLL